MRQFITQAFLPFTTSMNPCVMSASEWWVVRDSRQVVAQLMRMQSPHLISPKKKKRQCSILKGKKEKKRLVCRGNLDL